MSSFSSLVGALWYLRVTSLVGLIRSRLKRLRQPKYLAGAVVGALYFYWLFFRQTHRSGSGQGGSGSPVDALSADIVPMLGELGALVLLVVLAINWVIPRRAALPFSESEIAFLFPAPLSRRMLVQYRLLSAQFGIAFTALIFTAVFGRGHGAYQFIGWWLILALGNLHVTGTSFFYSRLLNPSMTTARKRALIVGTAAVVAVALLTWIWLAVPTPKAEELSTAADVARQGYKDNRPEYFFGTNSRAHLEKFASSGVFGLLFGAGAGGQSSYQNDTYTDGQLFLKSRAGSFLKAGGLTIPGGSTPPPPTTPPATDATDYNFEADTQGWTGSAPVVGVSRSTSQKFAGASSLAVRINGSGSALVSVANPAAKASQTVTFRVYLPAGAAISSIQPYVLQGASGGWRWTGNWQPISALKTGAWNTLTVQVPADAALLSSLGVQFTTNGIFNGTVYIDSVNF